MMSNSNLDDERMSCNSSMVSETDDEIEISDDEELEYDAEEEENFNNQESYSYEDLMKPLYENALVTVGDTRENIGKFL